MRELPEEKEITFKGEVSSPEAKKPYIPGDKREIKLHLDSNDEEAKDAKFKIVSWEVTNGKKGTLDVPSLQLGSNALSYTPNEPGTHELTIKVAIEGEEDSEQTFQCTIEATKSDWQVGGEADGMGNITLTITDASDGFHGGSWQITNVTWSTGLNGQIENIPTSLAYGTNSLQLTLNQVVLTESPWVRFTVKGPDRAYQTAQIDLREACIEKLRETLSGEELQHLKTHNAGVVQQAGTYQGNYAGTAREGAQRELGALYDTTTKLQAETTTQLERLVNNLDVLRNQNASGLTALDAKRTDLQRELAALDASVRILHPMVTRLRESNTGPIDSFGVLREALQQASYDATSMPPYLESPLLEVNKEDEQGKTLLHLAIEQGNAPLIQSLIGKGAETNIRNAEGKTPLQYAIDKNDRAAITLLRNAGAVQDLRSDWQLQGSYDASSQQFTLSINDTSEKPQRERRQQEQWQITNVTWSAGLNGQIENIPTSLAYGTNSLQLTLNQVVLTESPWVRFTVKGPDRAYQTAQIDLREACAAQLREKENALTECTDSVAQYVRATNTIYNLPPEVVSDPRVNRAKQEEIATLLERLTAFKKKYQEDIQAFSKNLTVLEQARCNEHLPVFNNKNKKLEQSIATLKSAQVQLQQQCTTAHEAFFKTLKNKDEAAFMILLDDPDLDVNSHDAQGETLLHVAAKQGNIPLIQHLLGRGADVNLANAKKVSPLQAAIMAGNERIMQHLLECGADVNKSYEVYNNSTVNTLQFVLVELVEGESPDRDWSSIIRKLLECGADVNLKDNHGKTSLHHAILTWNVDVIKMILKAGANVNAISNNNMSVLDEMIASVDNNPFFNAYACKEKILSIINLLVKRGACCNNKGLITQTTDLELEDINKLEKGIWSIYGQ